MHKHISTNSHGVCVCVCVMKTTGTALLKPKYTRIHKHLYSVTNDWLNALNLP